MDDDSAAFESTFDRSESYDHSGNLVASYSSLVQAPDNTHGLNGIVKSVCCTNVSGHEQLTVHELPYAHGVAVDEYHSGMNHQRMNLQSREGDFAEVQRLLENESIYSFSRESDTLDYEHSANEVMDDNVDAGAISADNPSL